MGMIETAPVLILQGVGYATAEGARMALARLGAAVEVRAYEVEPAGPPRTSPSPTSWPSAWEIVGLVFLILCFILVVLAVVASLIVANLTGDPTF
jgi:hypothetical protein